MPEGQSAQEVGTVKGDDIGFFWQVRKCLDDMREARKMGDPKLYKRVSLSLSIILEYFYDKIATKKHSLLDKRMENHDLTEWEYARELHKLLCGLAARCGFLPVKETVGVIEDDEI